MQKTIRGKDVSTGAALEIIFDESITAVRSAGGAEELYVAPGWIDVQVNGYYGVDYNSPRTSHEEISRSIDALFRTGVTRFYPTVITGSPEDMRGALANLAEAKEKLPHGGVMDGFHVEGPHISPEDGPRGAHLRKWVRPPDLEEFQRWQEAARGNIRLVTVAPDWPEAPRYIESLVAQGVVISVGHTGANTQQLADAVSAGASMSTHLGNGSHGILKRHPNYIWEQLAEDRLAASFIVDGIHIPASFFKPALRAKGVTRSVLVTDASAPAGAKPGRYALGEQTVDLTPDNRVVLAGQDKLAGSALSMDRAVRNAIKLGEISLPDAVTMATTNPAQVGMVPNRRNGLLAGDRADFVLFRYDPAEPSLHVEATYVAGECVYRV